MASQSRSTRISERISGSIKRQIAAGKLRAGERLLPEREMARRRKVSRVSVREAYRSLEELGLLSIRRGADGGAFVIEPGESSLHQSLSLILRLGRPSRRELTDAWTIDPTIARLAARNAQSKDITRLERVVEREEANTSAGEYRSVEWLRFQRAVAKCARNLPLAALANTLADLTHDAFPTVGMWPISRTHVCRTHRAIFEAIEAHDEDAAYQLMRQHIALLQNEFEGMGGGTGSRAPDTPMPA